MITTTLSPEALIQEVQWLYDNGVAPAAWAPQLNMTPGTLSRALYRYGRGDLGRLADLRGEVE